MRPSSCANRAASKLKLPSQRRPANLANKMKASEVQVRGKATAVQHQWVAPINSFRMQLRAQSLKSAQHSHRQPARVRRRAEAGEEAKPRAISMQLAQVIHRPSQFLKEQDVGKTAKLLQERKLRRRSSGSRPEMLKLPNNGPAFQDVIVKPSNVVPKPPQRNSAGGPSVYGSDKPSPRNGPPAPSGELDRPHEEENAEEDEENDEEVVAEVEVTTSST